MKKQPQPRALAVLVVDRRLKSAEHYPERAIMYVAVLPRRIELQGFTVVMDDRHLKRLIRDDLTVTDEDLRLTFPAEYGDRVKLAAGRAARRDEHPWRRFSIVHIPPRCPGPLPTTKAL